MYIIWDHLALTSKSVGPQVQDEKTHHICGGTGVPGQALESPGMSCIKNFAVPDALNSERHGTCLVGDKGICELALTSLFKGSLARLLPRPRQAPLGGSLLALCTSAPSGITAYFTIYHNGNRAILNAFPGL